MLKSKWFKLNIQISIVNFFKLLWQAINDLVNHDGLEYAGYLSFLIMLTIFPFLVFITALLGFFGSEQLGNLLVEIIIKSSWASFIDSLKPRIIEITSTPPQSLLTIAVLSALWTASSIFEGLRTILNRAYRVTQTPSYLLRRLISIFEFLVTISLVIILLLILIVLPIVSDFLHKLLHIKQMLIIESLEPSSEVIRFSILICFTGILVATLYNRLPNRHAKFYWCLPGAILVVTGWFVASIIFKYYLGHFPQLNFIYGSLAGIIISLLYFYICSIIFILGAEFNYQIESLYRFK